MYLCTVKCNISYEIYTKDVQENGKNYIHDELKYMKNSEDITFLNIKVNYK